jgi:hypothetical protein
MAQIATRHFQRPASSAFLAAPETRLREIPMLAREYLEKGRKAAERIPYSFIALISRFAVADVFWRSGRTIWNSRVGMPQMASITAGVKP